MKKIIKLRIQIVSHMGMDYSKKNIIRTVEFVEGSCLRVVAEDILSIFEFNWDHAFGIYDNLENPTEGYSVFADLDGDGDPMGGKSIEKAKVGRVFREEGKEMFMLFDYGDEWVFKIVCEELIPRTAGRERPGYPYTMFRQGEAIEQYPEY